MLMLHDLVMYLMEQVIRLGIGEVNCIDRDTRQRNVILLIDIGSHTTLQYIQRRSVHRIGNLDMHRTDQLVGTVAVEDQVISAADAVVGTELLLDLSAELLVDAMAEACPELKPYVRHYDFIVSAKGFGNYLTLQAAINNVPIYAKSTICVLDGEWKEPKITSGKKIKYVKFSGAKVE